MKLDLYLISYTKTNPKWIKDLNVRPKKIKFLEENTSEKLPDPAFDNDFSDMTPKAQAIRKNKQIGHLENLKFLHQKTLTE